MKKLVALLLALVLVMSLCATAFASKPTAALHSQFKNLTVKRGKTAKWVYTLKSGSYTKLYGYYWRSEFVSYICKGSINGKIVAWYDIYFSGTNKNKKVTWKVPKKIATGKYVNLYGTFYRSYGGKWKVNTAKTSKLKIKK